MLFNPSPSLSFDDILLVPQVSTILSRSECKLTQEVDIGYGYPFRLPIINAPMDSIASPELLLKLGEAGGWPCCHRFQDVHEQIDTLKYYHKIRHPIAIATIGANGTFERDARCILQALDQKIWLIDIANGYSSVVEEPIRFLRKQREGLFIIAGNVCDVQGFEYLAKLSVDAVRVGIGNGSMCTTRVKTGCGMGQFSAINEIANYRDWICPSVKIIADGGIKSSGDCVKALAAGADFVMLGRHFAGTDECPEWTKEVSSGAFIYRGQASKSFMADHGINNRSPEGEGTLVKARGSMAGVLKELTDGIKSGMAYCGARTLEELRADAVARMVSNSVFVEGQTRHG